MIKSVLFVKIVVKFFPILPHGGLKIIRENIGGENTLKNCFHLKVRDWIDIIAITIK